MSSAASPPRWSCASQKIRRGLQAKLDRLNSCKPRRMRAPLSPGPPCLRGSEASSPKPRKVAHFLVYAQEPCVLYTLAPAELRRTRNRRGSENSTSQKFVNRALGGARSGGALAPRATMMPESGSAASRRIEDATRHSRLRSGLLVALPLVALLVVAMLFVSERSVWAQDDDLNCADFPSQAEQPRGSIRGIAPTPTTWTPTMMDRLARTSTTAAVELGAQPTTSTVRPRS